VALGRARRIRVAGISIAASVFLATGLNAAVVFTVNSTDDGVDINPGNGVCSITPTPPYVCTLRAAVMEANRAPNAGATIMLPAGHYTLQIFPDAVDGEEKGDINLNVPSGYSPGPTTIIGVGASSAIIDANGIDRVFDIDANRIVNISGVSIINGQAFAGAGMRNLGSLTLADCVISKNAGGLSSGAGGGIDNAGSLSATRVTFSGNTGIGSAIYSDSSFTLSYCTLSGNHGDSIYNRGADSSVAFTTIAGNFGSGIFNNSGAGITLVRSTLNKNAANDGGGIRNYGTANVRQSTISNNSAGKGAGIENWGVLFVTSSTISSNAAQGSGGGIANLAGQSLAGTSNIYNTTIAFNEADSDANSIGDGAGISNDAGATLNLRNSVVADNYLAGVQNYDDCTGMIGMYGDNRFSPTAVCTVAAGSSGTATPLDSVYELGVLQNNGGPTETVALVPPSSMIDGAGLCIDQNSFLLATDQRGRPRVVGSSCDIGAFEYDADEIFPDGFEMPLP
jgi:CSLREA domain-containing protein